MSSHHWSVLVGWNHMVALVAGQSGGCFGVAAYFGGTHWVVWRPTAYSPPPSVVGHLCYLSCWLDGCVLPSTTCTTWHTSPIPLNMRRLDILGNASTLSCHIWIVKCRWSMQKFQSEMIKLGTQLLNKGDAINKPSIDQGLMSTHAVINFLPAYH